MHGIVLSSPYNTVQKHNNKEQSKTMINLTRLCMNLLGYWTTMCNQCLGKCYQPFDCDYSRYHKKAFNIFLNMRHVYMTAVKGDFVHHLLVSRFPLEPYLPAT